MKPLYLLSFSLVALSAKSQTDTIPGNINDSITVVSANEKKINKAPEKVRQQQAYKKNNIKINLSSLLLNNYSLFVERSLTKKITFQAGYRFQPKSSIWDNSFTKSMVKNAVELSKEQEADINSLQIKNQAITGEFRFYGGRKKGAKGFYTGLYGRYARFQIDYSYTYQATNGQSYNIPLRGKINGIGAGMLFGAQWWFAKAVCMDLYLIGGHYGQLSGSLTGSPDRVGLSETDKQSIKEDLEDRFQLGDKKILSVSYNKDRFTATASGPYIGIRAIGLSIGVVF